MIGVVTAPSPVQRADIAMFVASVTDRGLVLGWTVSFPTGSPSPGSEMAKFWAGSHLFFKPHDTVTRRIEDWCCRGDGAEFMEDVTIAPIKVAMGEVRGHGLSIVDVTTRCAPECMVMERAAPIRSALTTVPDARS